MSDAIFPECFISGLNNEIHAHFLMAWPQIWVDATKRAKEEKHVISSQNHKPSFIPCTKPVTPTPPSTPLKIQKLTRSEMDEFQLKGICYNCDDKYFSRHKCREKKKLCPSWRMFQKRMLRLPLCLCHLNPLT
jgi:hypothetical protein